jgi:hypothetical protein
MIPSEVCGATVEVGLDQSGRVAGPDDDKMTLNE